LLGTIPCALGKIKSKWVIELNLKLKITKYLKETEEILQPWLDKDFLEMTPKYTP
jgi:hypothetical protein